MFTSKQLVELRKHGKALKLAKVNLGSLKATPDVYSGRRGVAAGFS